MNCGREMNRRDIFEIYFRDYAVFVFGLEKCYFVVDGLVTSGKVG
jgi:hypothetical protein